MQNPGLIFPFAELRSECEALKAYAGALLERSTITALDEAKAALDSIQNQGSPDRPHRWEIPLDRPLCTIWSKGESQPNSRSKHTLQATLSFVWQIRPTEKRSKNFILDGLACTRITLIEKDGRHLAQWTVEVGDHQPPGTHFHFQLNGALDVPRLPAPVMSPFLAMEFVIGEIFQDRWKKLAAEDNKHTRRWRNLHKERLLRFFKWQAERVESYPGSPWMALKLAKPQSDLFVDLA